MTIRALSTRQRQNGDIHREFNHLRIENIEYFLNSMSNNYEPYKSPFKILEELENQVKFSDKPKETILIAYKEDGECIFDLIGISLSVDGRRIVTYEYSTTIG